MKLSGAICLALISSIVAASPQTMIYETGFERFEGFSEDYELWGQNAWSGFGSGGNGIFVEEGNQQAYLGAFPPTEDEDYLIVYQPVNFSPIAGAESIVRFSVTMEIVDSTNDKYDDFRWSVYNLAGDRLLCVNFDNEDFSISYQLEGEDTFTLTEYQFQPGDVYDLEIVMDVDANLWRAIINDTEIITGQPITSSPDVGFNLGDVDAVWFFHDPEAPGDNFMLFDDYRITVEKAGQTPPEIRILERAENGNVTLRVYGDFRSQYVVESSSSVDGAAENWSASLPMSPSSESGYFDFVDQTGGHFQHFYRVRKL